MNFTGKAGEKLSTVGFESDEDDIKVRDWGFALEFDLKDEKAMLQGNINPMQEKMNAAFLQERKFIFDMVINGGGIRGLTGFANAPTTGNGAIVTANRTGVQWTAAGITGDIILDDLNALYNKIGETTDGVSPANTMFIPLQALQIARSKRVANSSDSALRVFQESVQDATGEAFLVRQNQAFGKDILMGTYGADFARINIARTLEFGDIQAVDWGYKIPCRFACSGLELMDPFGFAKLPGIIA